jgi:hypothetical protein
MPPTLSFRFVRGLVIAAMIAVSWPVAGADFRTYRDFTLGASTADVLARAGAAQRDVKQVHARPAVLEDLSWRPPYISNLADRDSVSGIAFSFIDDRLFRMAVDYDRSRTEGLTNEDMITSLSAVYGPRVTVSSPAGRRTSFESPDEPTVLATWREGDTAITLHRLAFSRGFGLVITLVPLEELARKAQVTAMSLDAREAPVRAKAEADAAQRAEEQTRTANKAVFKP